MLLRYAQSLVSVKWENDHLSCKLIFLICISVCCSSIKAYCLSLLTGLINYIANELFKQSLSCQK